MRTIACTRFGDFHHELDSADSWWRSLGRGI